MFKWFWTIFSLGAPDYIIGLLEQDQIRATPWVSFFSFRPYIIYPIDDETVFQLWTSTYCTQNQKKTDKFSSYFTH